MEDEEFFRDALEHLFGEGREVAKGVTVFNLPVQPGVAVNPEDGTWALYIYDSHGLHTGRQWFS